MSRRITLGEYEMTIQFRGTNLAGGDTAWQDWSGLSPVSGTHYMFVTTQDIDYLLAQGMNCFRLLFGWEALQPSAKASIPSTIANHATYFSKFKAIVDYITSKGASVIVDIHDGNDADFAAYYGVPVGQLYKGVSVSSLLADLWGRLATIFKGNPRVIFGITNEPHDIDTVVWYSSAQATIDAIRAAGATNLIVMPGDDWTGAGSWVTDGNAAAWNLTDPLNNLAVQVHLYADANSGGGDTSVVSGTVFADRMKQVTTWARGKGLKVMVAEIGIAASNSLAAAAWKGFVDFVNANSDVVLGFTFWAYGPPAWWGGYQFSLCPTNNYSTPSAQMKLIASSLVGGVVVTPPPVVTPSPTPTTTPDPQIAQLQAQVSSLQFQLAAETSIANTALARVANAKAALG